MANFAVRRALSGLGRRLTGKPRQGVERKLPCVRLGTEYGGYALLKDSVKADSIVYSFGIGEDISFDLALIEMYGCQVFGFDPTPRSIAWVRAQNPPAAFHVQELGVAGYDGTASFAPPANPAHISHSMSAPTTPSTDGSGQGRVEFEVRRLPTLMKELGHERLDVLKMDIEGAEYDVIEDLLAQALRPTQILVEFHHGMHGIPVARTEAALTALASAGYAIFDVQPSGHEFSLALHAKG
jgi:FkbM family methyltransferase